jgi:signal transduction histidine kinase/CheY-like chemotaxis protein
LGRLVPEASENAEALPLSTAVARLADALASATSADEIYEAALDGVCSAAPVDRAAILFFDEAGMMRFRAWRGLSDKYREAVDGHSPWKAGEPSPVPIVVPDVEADSSLAGYLPALARENIRALAFVPLVSRGKTVGKFMLYWSRPSLPSGAAVEAAQTIGAFVVLAVERAKQNASSVDNENRMHAALQNEADARGRLGRLATGSQRLQRSLEPQVVLSEVLALAQHAVKADAYAIWRRQDDLWRVAASSGLDESFTATELPATDSLPLDRPIVAEDVAAAPALDHRRDAYANAGIQSLLTIPLQIRGRPDGTISFYFRQKHRPSELELSVAEALGQLAAAAISNAELFAEQQTLKDRALRAAERAEFLAHISARLTSLDHERNLTAIANLVVPEFADWCVVDLLESGQLRRLAVAHADAAKVEAARELERRYPPRRDTPGGFWHVIHTGESALFAHIDDAALERSARDADHLMLLRSVGLRSAMLLPLKRDDVFGVLTLVRTSSERPFDRDDLEFGEEVARRASYAIENARLYRQAQDASRAKDDFLAALSHELRTPLNAILGWASILRARPEGEIGRGLDVIYRNAVVQTQLVDDLLDASRIVTGRMSIEVKDVPLRPILEAAIETVLPQAVEKAIEVDSTLPDPRVLIRGDGARMQQVFWNVLSNAVKFTPRGGRIAVRTEISESEIAVHLQDTGAGIRPEALPYIFDRFKQADASATTRRYRGLGLGLTLSRQLTEMHGGHIAATSPGPGLGSIFTVALPLVERVPASAPKIMVKPADNVLEGLRILVVDDDPDSLEMLLSLLRAQHAIVTGAASAVEALEFVEKERPHVVVSDIAMPDRDGYWLMEQLRRLATEGGPNVPGIALTAFANQTMRERALATGFVAHLSKPFDPDQLVSTLRSAVNA